MMLKKTDFATTLRQRKRIDDVLVYLDRSYDEYIDLSQLSEISCYSPFHFQRLFSEFIGETWSEYLRRYRLLLASQRLKFTTEKIFDIAVLAGFSTQTGFLKAFKHWSGYSPSQYRAEYTGESGAICAPSKSKRPSTLHPKLINLKSATVLVERGYGSVNGHFDQVAWQALHRLLKRVHKNKELQCFIPSLVCYVNKYAELFKGSHAEYIVGLAVDTKTFQPEKDDDYVRVSGGLYAEFEHFGPMYEHTLHKVLFQWIPQSIFELQTDRQIYFLPRMIPSEVYDRLLFSRPASHRLIYENLRLNTEQLATFNTRILIPLSEHTLNDEQRREIYDADLLIHNGKLTNSSSHQNNYLSSDIPVAL